MNHHHIEAICAYYNLGESMEPPKRVYGGLLHRMWCLRTNQAVYAVKQLSQDINLSDPHIVNNYNLTEDIASRFIKKGIPAVCALKQSDNHLLIIDGNGFLVYPWLNASALDKNALSEHAALQIAALLARMHAIHLKVPEILEPQFDLHTDDDLNRLVQKADEYQCSFIKVLQNELPILLKTNTAYHHAIPILKQNTVISHGDLDQKNVLWNEHDHPILIDWESARTLNPTYEIVNASLDWSGITTTFNQDLFKKMLTSYKESGGIIDTSSFAASLYGVLGNWINWLVYNIERSCSSTASEQRIMGIEQVNQVLPTITRLHSLISKLSDN